MLTSLFPLSSVFLPNRLTYMLLLVPLQWFPLRSRPRPKLLIQSLFLVSPKSLTLLSRLPTKRLSNRPLSVLSCRFLLPGPLRVNRFRHRSLLLSLRWLSLEHRLVPNLFWQATLPLPSAFLLLCCFSPKLLAQSSLSASRVFRLRNSFRRKVLWQILLPSLRYLFRLRYRFPLNRLVH